MGKLLELLLCCFTTIVIAAATNTCSITLPNEVKGPVILTRINDQYQYELFKPISRDTLFLDGFQFLFACPGRNNTIESVDATNLELQCRNGQFVDSNNNAYQLSELLCRYIPTSTLQVTLNRCSNGNGFFHNAGFTIEGKFYGPVFEICFNGVISRTFYTRNIINGAAIKYAVHDGSRRAFSPDGSKYTMDQANKFYNVATQVPRFEKLLGSGQTYIKNDGSHYFARGHLTPHADFVFGYEQLSTYYLANVAPEYQRINAGNWLRVEELARLVAGNYGSDIESYNGYKDILQFPNKSGSLVNISLDDAGEIKAPKYFYKVLVHRASDSGIAFVTVNNPYITNGTAEVFCQNVCKESGLIHDNFPILSKGFTFCCTLDQFLSWENSLPAGVQARKLLKRNKQRPIYY